MSVLSLNNVSASLGQFNLKNISFSIEKDETLVILGENGAGKTKLLEAIMGFLKILSGRIILSNNDITHLLPEERNIGCIFQHLALFPHMTVKENILYGLQFKRVNDMKTRFNNAVDAFYLSKLLDRKPTQISGGEAQRVALVRTLVTNPDIILFDESTSELSTSEKDAVYNNIKSTLKSFGKSAIFTTHNLSEAFEMSNRIAIMHDGEITQIDDKYNVCFNPKFSYVASFFAYNNKLSGYIINKNNTEMILRIGEKELYVKGSYNLKNKVNILIKPDNIHITREKGHCKNSVLCKIVDIKYNGYVFIVSLDCGFKISSFITKYYFDQNKFCSGESVYANFNEENIIILDRELDY